jgi:hypothetical protein
MCAVEQIAPHGAEIMVKVITVPGRAWKYVEEGAPV